MNSAISDSNMYARNIGCSLNRERRRRERGRERRVRERKERKRGKRRGRGGNRVGRKKIHRLQCITKAEAQLILT